MALALWHSALALVWLTLAIAVLIVLDDYKRCDVVNTFVTGVGVGVNFTLAIVYFTEEKR